jgi:hypothetical protein
VLFALVGVCNYIFQIENEFETDLTFEDTEVSTASDGVFGDNVRRLDLLRTD